MTVAYRYLDKQALRRLLIEADEPRHVFDVVIAVSELVDYKTGESHPKYPITLERIAQQARYSISRVCDALLEASRWIKRFAMPAQRQADGTFRQLPTDYKFLEFDKHKRDVQRVESTVAARVADVLPVAHTLPWSITVQGKLSTQDASSKTRRAPRSWVLDPTQPTTFIDDLHYDKLAPKLLEAAQFVAAGVDDSIRERTVVCLNALRERALDVALLACNLDLSSWDAVNCIKHWVARCVTNARQRVDSAEHAINILRKFFLEQQAWAMTKGAERIDAATRAKYKRFDDEAAARTGDVEREAMRKKCAHIKVGRGEYVAPVQVDEVPVDDFGYDPNDPAIPF